MREVDTEGETMYWSDGHWVWGTLMMLAFLVPVILLIVVLLREPRSQERKDQDREPGSAREILEERFARGEIGTEEFTERSKVLQHRPG
jgi:putative membrane protein